MLLKCVDVLIEVEQTGDEDFDLIISQMTEGGFEQRRDVVLDVEDVVRRRPETDRDPAGLDQREHVRQNGRMVLQAGRVRGVRYYREDLHQDVREVGLVETLRCLWVLLEVLQHLVGVNGKGMRLVLFIFRETLSRKLKPSTRR